MPNNFDNPASCSEKICIQAKKVFDACMKQSTLQQITVAVSDVTPAAPAEPLRFVSLRSNTSVGVLQNVVVERLDERRRYGRVQADVVIPVDVAYVDANNVDGSGTGTIVLPIDVVMFLPEPSLIPYQIEATVSAVSPDGAYSTSQVISGVTYYLFIVNCCVTVIIKVTMDVDLIVQTLGYAQIPPCQDYTQEVCSGYFELPLYPTGNTTT